MSVYWPSSSFSRVLSTIFGLTMTFFPVIHSRRFFDYTDRSINYHTRIRTMYYGHVEHDRLFVACRVVVTCQIHLPLCTAIIIPTINGPLSAKNSGLTSRRADNVLAHKLSETKLVRILAVLHCARTHAKKVFGGFL